MAASKRNRRPASNRAADFRNDDQCGSRGTYSSSGQNATQAEIERRYRAHRSGKVTIGKCILAEKSRRHVHRFRVQILRMREVEKIIDHRYGRFLPENDGDEFFVAIAHAVKAAGSSDVLSDLRQWCWHEAPWALNPVYSDTLSAVASSVGHRVHDLRADAVARLLYVTVAERQTLQLRTIGAADVSPAELRKIMKERKMGNDRERQKAKRKAEGRQDRAEYEAGSLSKTKPWQAEGMSRAAWYRARKLDRETSVSRIEDTWIGDTPVSSPAASSPIEAPAPRERRLPASERGSSMPRAEKPARREAKPPAERSPVADRSPEQGRAADLAKFHAVFDFFHRHNRAGGRWVAVPGSATDVRAA